MRYEFEKLLVTLVSGEIERVRTFFLFFFILFYFFSLVCIYRPKYDILSDMAEMIRYGPVFKLERNNHVFVSAEVL